MSARPPLTAPPLCRRRSIVWVVSFFCRKVPWYWKLSTFWCNLYAVGTVVYSTRTLQYRWRHRSQDAPKRMGGDCALSDRDGPIQVHVGDSSPCVPSHGVWGCSVYIYEKWSDVWCNGCQSCVLQQFGGSSYLCPHSHLHPHRSRLEILSYLKSTRGGLSEFEISRGILVIWKKLRGHFGNLKEVEEAFWWVSLYSTGLADYRLARANVSSVKIPKCSPNCRDKEGHGLDWIGLDGSCFVPDGFSCSVENFETVTK